jgi:hypothetical protein
MTQHEIKHANEAALKKFGLMRPTYVAVIKKSLLKNLPELVLKSYEDDLDAYEAGFLTIDNVPAIVRRYRPAPPDQYTILVDDGFASNCGLSPFKLSEELLSRLNVEEDSIVWRNDGLAQPVTEVKAEDKVVEQVSEVLGDLSEIDKAIAKLRTHTLALQHETSRVFMTRPLVNAKALAVENMGKRRARTARAGTLVARKVSDNKGKIGVKAASAKKKTPAMG